MFRSTLSPSCAQDLLDSATNAGDKGLAQYFTPPDLARALARPLPAVRPTIVDLSCGQGALLKAARNSTTEHLLGCDIDPGAIAGPAHPPRASVVECGAAAPLSEADCRAQSAGAPAHSKTLRAASCPPTSDLRSAPCSLLPADALLFLPLLRALDWRADLFTLNPPWGLHWPFERLAYLAESETAAVVATVEALRASGARTMDSTQATLCLALDRMTSVGEGYLVANAATAQRLILNSPLCGHVWATFEGRFFPGISCPVMVLYFARRHLSSLRPEAMFSGLDTLPALEAALREPSLRERREGAIIRDYLADTETVPKWQAAAQEFQARQATVRSDYHIRLESDGAIATSLNTFEELTAAFDAEQVQVLHNLNGKTPAQLVLQRAERAALEKATAPDSIWRVQPELTEAVRAAVECYHLHRAPLHPLNDIQRLGYLDESDEIVCRRDYRTGGTLTPTLSHPMGEGESPNAAVGFACPGRPAPNGASKSPPSPVGRERAGVRAGPTSGLRPPTSVPRFLAGHSYSIRTHTIGMKRHGQKRNLVGDLENVEYHGQELAVWLMDDDGAEACFVPNPALAEGITLEWKGELEPDALHPLSDLLAHFIVPAVSDVASLDPAGYQRHVRSLRELEFLLPPMLLKEFQREDLARLALTDGGLLAWDTGLGKTWAMFLWPLLKTGYTLERHPRVHVRPNRPVLIVAPPDLHPQIAAEAQRHFRIEVTLLEDQAAFRRLVRFTPRPTLPPGFYLVGYNALARNGAHPFPETHTFAELGLSDADAREYFDARYSVHEKVYRRLVAEPGMTRTALDNLVRQACRLADHALQAVYHRDFATLAPFHCDRANPTWNDLPEPNRAAIRAQLRDRVQSEYADTIGKKRDYSPQASALRDSVVECGAAAPLSDAPRSPLPAPRPLIPAPCSVRCVYEPTLVDLCRACFDVVVIDEGTKIQNSETLVAAGLDQLETVNRLVLTATPIKNRLPSIFNLVCWALRIGGQATARFPYTAHDADDFAEEFLVTETNLTKLEESGSRSRKRYTKYTAQVCSIHRLWKLFGPIIVRRTKQELARSGSLEIVGRHKHIVRVPLGKAQKEVYDYHLAAKYRDQKGKPAPGAKLQALRLAATDPSSRLLQSKAEG